MPTVVGLDQQDAEKLLASAGLKVAKVNMLTGTDSPKGTVIGQTPARGSRIDATATVELGVAE